MILIIVLKCPIYFRGIFTLTRKDIKAGKSDTGDRGAANGANHNKNLCFEQQNNT